MSKVAVIVPIFNAQAYLTECIQSVLSQSHRDLLVFLVNDGSGDESLEIAKHFAAKDERIVLIDKPNSGASESRNGVLELLYDAYGGGQNGEFSQTGDYACFEKRLGFGGV